MHASQSSNVLYTNSAFTVYADRVEQGDNLARALSPTHLTSNYRSPASATYSRLILFNVSINEKDNELPSGEHHWVVVGEGEHESPVITFGVAPEDRPPLPLSFLPVNVPYTFRVDVSPVLEQFRERGYYETFDGRRIAADDFKGFYLAGGSEPLTWDYVSLEEHGLKLSPTEDPGIYSLRILLNPYHAVEAEDREWRAAGSSTPSGPRYQSGQLLVDALFRLALEEAAANVEADGTFRTGAEWSGVWTRDISYSILLAFAYLDPVTAKTSLRRKVKDGRIVQDTGSGGAWPVSSDRTTWVVAAWEIYLVTGDQAWLREVYPIVRDTLEDDRRTLRDPATGLYRGESSFLDWREQTYPKWMTNADIYASLSLGTNAVHFRAHEILALMAEALGEAGGDYAARAGEIRSGINDHLWLPDRGYYAQYLYGRAHPLRSDRFEALGGALAVLFGVADAERATTLIRQSPVTPFGASCIYPQIPGIPPYHNNGIWPFVQAFWNLAAARAGNESALRHGLGAIYRAAGLFLTNYENMVAETGDFLGTEINSRRMLWSIAGNLAMVFRVFLGMSFHTDGLRFAPAVPEAYRGTRRLTGFSYRRATLSITVEGFGNQVHAFTLDGEPRAEAFFPADLTGGHEVVIRLSNTSFTAEMNLLPNAFSLPTPRTLIGEDQLAWHPVAGASSYRLYRDGALWKQTEATRLSLAGEQFTSLQVSAVGADGYESFASESLRRPARVVDIPLEDFAPASGRPATGYSGRGFVEITATENREIQLPLTLDSGTYLLELRYANGSGPVNTDNKCAIRSLYLNGEYRGVLVFPQRGQDEWSDWGWSNTIRLDLEAGEFNLRISFEPWNSNMDGRVNTALLDVLRLTRCA